jgi:hypothetical protein
VSVAKVDERFLALASGGVLGCRRAGVRRRVLFALSRLFLG